MDDDELGTLEPGKLADVIVVAGDPLVNIEAMSQVVVVVVGHMASLPLDTNILSLAVMATKMPFVGRGWSGVPVPPRRIPSGRPANDVSPLS